MNNDQLLFQSQHRVHVVQGEQYVDSNPDTMLTTILASRIAACLWDAEPGLGGMNHFLLPGDGVNSQDASGGTPSSRYGAYAMELLVHDLLPCGPLHGAIAYRQNSFVARV